MAQVTQCDLCGKIEQHPASWCRVKMFGVVSVNQPVLPDPCEFCSLECLALWASQKAERNVATKLVEVLPRGAAR